MDNQEFIINQKDLQEVEGKIANLQTDLNQLLRLRQILKAGEPNEE